MLIFCKITDNHSEIHCAETVVPSFLFILLDDTWTYYLVYFLSSLIKKKLRELISLWTHLFLCKIILKNIGRN